MAPCTPPECRRILTICGFCKENDSQVARECFRKLPLESQLYLRLFLNILRVREISKTIPKNSGNRQVAV